MTSPSPTPRGKTERAQARLRTGFTRFVDVVIGMLRRQDRRIDALERELIELRRDVYGNQHETYRNYLEEGHGDQRR